jgi:hypothetical protein
VKKSKPLGFPITAAQLRYADKRALARLLRFLNLDVWDHNKLANILNEGVTVLKRAHIAVNRKKA